MVSEPPEGSLEALGGEAYRYLLPVLETERTRSRMLGSGLAPNTFRHVRELADARARLVTTPNNDTLYSSAWLDLSAPVEIEIPAVGDRYLSVALMDAFTNNFAVLRGRAGTAQRVTVAAGQAPRADAIAAPGRWAWALARTHVWGPDDLGAARWIQEGLRIAAAPVPAEPVAHPPPRAEVAAVFAAAGQLLARTCAPPADDPLLGRLAPAGVGAGLDYPGPALEGAGRARFEAGARAALAGLSFADGPAVDGWIYPRESLGDFGTDYAYRASIALTGLAALPLSEAIYLKGAGDAGDAVYDGGFRYRLRFPPGGSPPVSGFWSLALYEITSDGQLFFFDNPAGRYSIGSHSPGLARDADGGLTLIVAAEPGDASGPNWLPAPQGPFALQLRAFRPESRFLSGAYRPPAVERL